jgi:hypothetical protein
MRSTVGKWLTAATIVAISGSLVFLFGPSFISAGYTLTASQSQINALKTQYEALAKTNNPSFDQRRVEIADRLAMRRVHIDPGIRDEAVEHAPIPVAMYGMARWAWSDLFRYWSQPAEKRSTDCLLSPVTPQDAQ